jgi:hypothetical protein
MTTMHQVGPDAIGECDEDSYFNKHKYIWVVYWYESGYYDGYGDAVSWDGDRYRFHSLSHCSCYGPEDGLVNGDIISPEAITGDSVTPGTEIRKEIVDKVKELIGG